jgi:hypothetical protein
MTPRARRFITVFCALFLLTAGCLLFPRVLAFVELAARELRYLWWLILIVLLGIWLAFSTNTKR